VCVFGRGKLEEFVEGKGVARWVTRFRCTFRLRTSVFGGSNGSPSNGSPGVL
jgi:hypothetical protein